jgi:hypothetical protein
MVRLVIATLLIAGCYSPATPPGAYRCSAADQTCPSGQHCTCNLCVNSDNQAACSFAVDVGSNKTVAEHQLFTVTVTAYQTNKSVASGFNGPVTLSSTWGDVQPSDTVMLKNGVGKAQISLNRETLSPQVAKLSASFAGNSGAGTGVSVTVPSFVKDMNPIAAPPTPQQPYGFADTLVAQPDVIKVGNGWRMYFGGVATGTRYVFGVATSSDGINFMPAPSSVLNTGGAPFNAQSINSPGVFVCKGVTNMAFAGTATGATGSTIGMATSPDGLMPFALASNLPVIRRTDCDYCTTFIDFPTVIPDPTVGGDGGTGCGNWLMFFSASANGVVSIGSASSTDGLHFTPTPAPLLSGEVGGEALLFSPRVIVDGSVYKMFYSFTKARDLKNNPCDSPTNIGYATSTDGLYWIRSPSNIATPALASGGGGAWEAGVLGFLSGSVVASDGVDPKSGLVLYYSTFRLVTLSGPTGPTINCVPNGIGRAVRATPPPL